MALKTNTIVKKESGAALVVALIMLVVITLIALASSYTSIFEIKISGNKRGGTNAFYAADACINCIQPYASNFDWGNYSPIVGNSTTSQYNPFVGGNVVSPNPTNAAGQVIYYNNQTGPPRGGGFSAVNVAYAYYQIICNGSDTVGSGANSQISEDVTRLLPVQ
jgi:hypothetical protein